MNDIIVITDDDWKCTSCNITIKSCSKYKHLKSKRHQQRSQSNQSNPEKKEEKADIEDCSICMEPMTNKPKSCRSCHQTWCKTCDRNIPKCPYCRMNIPGRQSQAREQAVNNYNWYASSEAFVPQPSEPQRRNAMNEYDVHLLMEFQRRVLELFNQSPFFN